MTLFEILILILFLEILILIALIFALAIQRVVIASEAKKMANERSRLSSLINECLEGKQVDISTLHLDRKYSKKTLLSVLENYNRRFKDDTWNVLKETFSCLYLLPTARKWSKSFFWDKRNFSARCFSLSPLMEDTAIIQTLLQDSVLLVRCNSAAALARLGTKDGIKKILERMTQETGYAHFFYRDILLREESAKVFTEIQEISSENYTETSLHLVCLDLLASKTMTLSYPDLKKDLRSDNELIRLAAVKIYARNPQKDSMGILFHCIDDSKSAIRAEAAYGLGYFISITILKKLEASLSDPVWDVREQAAWSLKRMGSSGMNILKNQDPIKSPLAHAAAEYALKFDW